MSAKTTTEILREWLWTTEALRQQINRAKNGHPDLFKLGKLVGRMQSLHLDFEDCLSASEFENYFRGYKEGSWS